MTSLPPDASGRPDRLQESAARPLPVRIDGLGEIAGRFDAGLFDLWGTLHDGERLFAEAVTALARFSRDGRAVVLLSNSPQREARVARRLVRLGLDPSLCRDLVTSGEMARRILVRDWTGRRFLHLGPAFDRPTVEGLPLDEVGRPEDADVLLVTGPVHAEIEAHLELLRAARRAGAVMLVANPDRRVVHRGREVACAGLLGDLYARLGGRVILAGKPDAAIYEEAFRRLVSRAGVPPSRARVLAVGDGMETDVAGARRQGLDVLFVEDGLHGPTIRREGPERFFACRSRPPTWRIGRLRW